MDWQDYTVWAIGLAVAAVIVRRLVCLFRGHGKGGCASCGSAGCLLRNHRKTHHTGKHSGRHTHR